MEQLAQNIWVFDGPTVRFFGFPFTTRMTVVRLANGALWLHSPIQLSDSLVEQINQLGTVDYLIAPNHLHHLFLADWLEVYPEAQLYGTNEVIKKRQDLAFDGSLNVEQQWPWREEIEQELFTGSPAMQECVFFHPESRTLIVTDLVENFAKQHFNYWQRPVAKGIGILAPHGQMPLDWRLSFMFGKAKARQHMMRILAWQPQTLVMSHGNIVYSNAESFLRRSFRWLIQ
ncbi:hypothetical protein VISI1226_05224 [Vibrio sinaloensis DSM 21326]|uniref:DUF4336 domain-containing protein n=1 Tax=Vibrio sinaloensis DSM 21326 TaxID=945550 RepID=E8M1J9_PHOS4|nr:DUF4336 domain-containing protein [Vibrio sinaloensis]EGA72179.1 hypothetical protein VISI1226_05224 [Vibrio sinaloensis DSM 21326]